MEHVGREIGSYEVWTEGGEAAMAEFEDLLTAAKFGWHIDGVVVWGEWPYTRAAEPKKILAIYN